MTRAAAVRSEQLSFDTGALPSDEAFARYRVFYGYGTEVRRLGPAVAAQVDAWRLDRMLLYDRRLNDLGHERDARRTQSDGMNHFTATLLLAGRLSLELQNGLLEVRPGQVVLADVRQPMRNAMQHAHLVTLSIARNRIAAITSDPDALHGLVITADQARLFREFVQSLIPNLPTMSNDATAPAASVLMTLLMIAIDNSGGGRAGAPSPRDLERLTRFKRLVDARLADPEFDAAAAVREAGLSRATIYRLLAAEGGLATFIRNRRLDHVRKRLSDPFETRPLSELVQAAGLPSASHASRAFLERYDVRPSVYRDVVQLTSGEDAFYKLRFWQEEVR